MVRIVALGLLIAGITPTALANSLKSSITETSTIDRLQSASKLACKQSKVLPCGNKAQKFKLNNHGDLWLRDIAQSILPDSPFLICNSHNGGKIKKSWIGNFSLSSFGTIANSSCGFTWQQERDRQLVAFGSNESNGETLQLNSAQSYQATPKFPQLSRSSLIVNFPLDNSTFVPFNTKLANPAPATKRIASPFGWRNRPYSNQLQFHQGIDYGAPFGSTVVSVGNGIVTRVVSGCADFGSLFCGGQLGNWIEVDHGNGIVGTYGHLKRSSIAVKEGTRVGKNQPIAQVGSSGWSTGAHLDFRLKVNGKHEDPAKYVMAIEPERIKAITLE